MKGYLAFCFLILFSISCSSTKAPVLQSFNPIPIDLQKVDQKDYSEVVDIVNKNYAGSSSAFGNAAVLKEAPPFLYLRVFSLTDDGACYRVSIDRNRSKIINIQPDCSVVVE